MIEERLKVLFLGGLGEVGKNLLVLEFGEDIIIVDAGIGFPEEDMFGVDLLIPDLTYLHERADNVRGIFITHGHEDHIGALAYLLGEVEVPVYSTLLTQGLIRTRLRDRRVARGADLRLINPDSDDVIDAGCFAVEAFRVCHSIPDAVGFAIMTPVGMVVITGDFKLDPNPVDGRVTDVAKLRSFAERQPLLLISDCVHVETRGATPTEAAVENSIDAIVASAPKRVILATFASSISRVQQVLNVAYLHDRKVACFGRSLQSNVKVALELGYLKPPPNTLIRPSEAARLSPERVLLLCTGSQGEPMAVLNRIAQGEHQEIDVLPDDTVILSASPIPGNETSVFRVINQLFSRGADVIYSARALVHVSGHAGRDELRQMLEMVRPRYVLPTHGEARHLALYAQMARESGMGQSDILLGENGTVFGFDNEGFSGTESVPTGTVYLGPGSTGKIEDGTVWERRLLARDGVLSVVLTIDRHSGELVADPDISARGFVPGPKNGHVLEEARQHLRDLLLQPAHPEFRLHDPEQKVRDMLQSYVFAQTRRRPLVVPTVIEV
ncbi:MAG: ribonuclease J [Nitrolancea sp.]